MSVVSEIKIASKYIMAGYKVKNEPGNKKIGKSGLEGKSDLAVKWNDEWIYFEITKEIFPTISNSNISMEQITKIATEINEQIMKQNPAS